MNLNRNARRVATLGVGLAIVFGAGAGVSYADTSGTGSVGGGNQISVPVNLPINACGNSVSVIGGALSACQGGASAPPAQSGLDGRDTNGSGSVLGGNQISIPVTAPVNACGNSVGIIGIALSGCTGGSAVRTPSCCGRSAPQADVRDVEAPQSPVTPVLENISGSDLGLPLIGDLTQSENGLLSGLSGIGQ